MSGLSRDILDLHAELGEIESEADSGHVEEALRKIDSLLSERPEGLRLALVRCMRARILVRHRGLLSGVADYKEALAAAPQSIAVMIRYELGVAWKEEGDFAEAVSLLQQAVSDAEALRNWHAVARAKEHLSSSLESLGQIDDARRLAREADDAWAKTDDIAERARGLRRFAEFEFNQRELGHAENRFREAQSLYLRAGLPDMAVEVQTQLTTVLQEKGNTAAAIDQARDSVATAEKIAQQQLPRALYSLGLVLTHAPAQDEEAERLLGTATQEAVRRNQPLIGAQASGDLASLLAKQERLEEALLWNERSNAMYRDAGETRGMLICCHNAADFYVRLGRTEDQIGAIRQALEVARSRNDQESVLELRSKLAVALGTPESAIDGLIAVLEMGQRNILAESETEEHFERRSQQFFDGMLTTLSKSLTTGEALDLVAKVVHSTSVDQLRLSIALSGAALEKWRGHQGREWPQLHFEHGSMIMRLGDFTTARQQLLSAYRRAKELGDTQLQVACANNLALACQGLGEVDQARRTIEEAIPLAADPSSSDSLKLNLAVTHMRVWDFSPAEPLLTSVLDSAQRRSDKRMIAAAVSNLAALKVDTGRVEEAVELVDRFHDYTGSLPLHELLDFLRIKAYVLQAAGRRQEAVEAYEEMVTLTDRVRGLLVSPELQMWFLGARQHFYPDPIRLLLGEDPRKALYFAEVGRARALADTLRSPRQGTHSVPVDLASIVQAKLSRSEVVIAYYVAKGQVFIWAVSSDGLRSTAVDVNTDELLQVIQGYRVSLDNHSEDHTLQAKLTDWLVHPISGWLEPYTTVCFSPHGPLHLVPFQALGTGQRLVQSFNIASVPALHLLDQKPTWDQSWRAQPLVIGDPLGDLPAARQEAHRIAQALPGSVVLLGRDATKSRVLQRLEDASLVHFASHALFDHRNPIGSGICLVDDDGTAQMLSIPEIVRVTGKQPRLVVLSACETRLTTLSASDDPVGLPTAFLIAGAETIVSSLWRVPDEDTAELMKSLYSALRTMPPIEALSEAQRTFANGPHGADASRWAAFSVYTIASSRRVRDRPGTR